MIQQTQADHGGEAIETISGEPVQVGERGDRSGSLPGRAAADGGVWGAAPVTSDSPPPALLRALWGGMARVAQAMGWRRFLISDTLAAITCLARPGRVAECAARHRRADPSLAEAAALARARASYREYYRTCVDLVWAHSLVPATVRREHPVDGLEKVRAARRDHGAGIFCLAHFGNWDMAATMALSHGVPLSTVMREFRPAAFNHVIVWARERRGLEVFTPGRAARGLTRALRRGRFLALLPDIPEGGPTVEVCFQGGPVRFSTGPAILARHTGCPLFPVACFRDGRHYRIVVGDPVPPGTVGEMTQELAERLASLIGHAPEQWYPFNTVWTDER